MNSNRDIMSYKIRLMPYRSAHRRRQGWGTGGTFPPRNWKNLGEILEIYRGSLKMYVSPTRNQNNKMSGGAYAADNLPRTEKYSAE